MVLDNEVLSTQTVGFCKLLLVQNRVYYTGTIINTIPAGDNDMPVICHEKVPEYY